MPRLISYSDTLEEVLTQMDGTHSDKQFTGEETMGSSQIPAQDGKVTPFPGCRAMTQGDIDTVVVAFRQVAIRVKDAGFDGIQLHGAHGYLFSQFLSPFYNTRTDKYGGRESNRACIVVDTYNSVRTEVDGAQLHFID